MILFSYIETFAFINYKCLPPFFVYTYLKVKLKMQFTPNKYLYYAAAIGTRIIVLKTSPSLI